MDPGYRYDREGHRGYHNSYYHPDSSGEKETGSEIYVMDNAARVQRPGSAYSHYSSVLPAASISEKAANKRGVLVETMAAPNPCCPNTKGVCCLLLLINLGLILVTLGFSIVLQLFDPPFVWYCGILFLIVGFIALVASLIFCVHLCRESRRERAAAAAQPGEMFWTHHWQKRIDLPSTGGGIGGRSSRKSNLTSESVYSVNDRATNMDYDSNLSSSQHHGYGGHQNLHQQLQHSSSDDRRNMTPIHSTAKYRN